MKVSELLRMVHAWSKAAERHWYQCPHDPELGCYGTGYNSWGVQTNQKYLAAMATLAVHPDSPAEVDRDWALARAQAALRFSLASHVSGSGRCTDDTQWGHTWISGLGIERMMHGVYRLESLLTDQDRSALQRVLISESNWLMDYHSRGAHQGITAGLWGKDGCNSPESNLWNGALLWRTAMMYPNHSRAADWQERAHQFLINAVSIPADAQDNGVVSGRPIHERHIGANFFPHYALDHHGYFNVGYMVVCVSNAAMLYFDMRQQNWPVPASLHHHQADLWRVLRRMIFSNGRLARLGGDTRVRYAYCQEYLVPALLYAAAHLDDQYALDLLDQQMAMIRQENLYNGDGSFYGRRLAPLAERSPYYYTRMESDRACVLSQGCAYWPLLPARRHPEQAFEDSVAGSWSEPDHGAACQRSIRRLASFSWRAHGLAQGLCQPPANGHLCDWDNNLSGRIEFVSQPAACAPNGASNRRLINGRIDSFDGGFLACGALREGVDTAFCEGWKTDALATHQLVYAALPDDRTVVGLQHCRLGKQRAYLFRAMGLHFNLANDVFNGFTRTLHTRHGRTMLASPPPRTELLALDCNWVNVDDQVGVVGLYGATEMQVSRSIQRRGGVFQSLYVDELAWGYLDGPCWLEPGAMVFDVGWLMVSSADARATETVSSDNHTKQLDTADASLRAVAVRGGDGNVYIVIANFGQATRPLPGNVLMEPVVDLASGQRLDRNTTLTSALDPGTARILAIR